ncbi:transposase [Shewanella algae]|uniref:RNA-guided endonuclease InsQ/TnpB family protein n=1 Tax=Shewanella algae TaxID=38313 RepID=UPI0030053DD2
MLTGIRYKVTPTDHQAQVLSQWIGCARAIWNAKCDEDRYFRAYARKYLPAGTFPKPDKSYSQYKTELTPWLKDCPSQILRNSATIWAQTYQDFFKGRCGRPRPKNRIKGNYIWLTRELFQLTKDSGRWVLRLGTKKNDLGVLKVKWHRKPRADQLPNSIWIRVEHGRWSVSFSYDDGKLDDRHLTNHQHLDWLRQCSAEQLEGLITPLDRGVARPVQTHNATYTVDARALQKQRGREKYLKRCQRKLARQKKGSNKRRKTHGRIASIHRKTANVRDDFLHQTSRSVVDSAKVIVMEDLKLANMTKRAAPVTGPAPGRWLANGARAKSGLNKALLGVGLNRLETYIAYKAHRQNKPVFKVNPMNTSRECAACGHTHPDNRQTQARFRCVHCGHADNADRNAALVIRKRAISLILHSGTELVGARKNVLRPGANANPRKTPAANAAGATGCSSKKTAA